MIVCKKCGFNNSDADAFCGSCGAFLEWTGEKVTPAPAPEPAHVAPEPAAPVEPARRGGFMALVQQVTAIGVPKKEAIDPPGTTRRCARCPRPGWALVRRPLRLPPRSGRRRPGPLAPPSHHRVRCSAPPGSAPPSGPPRSAPPSSPPPSGPPLSAPPTSPPPAGPPRSAPPSGPPSGAAAGTSSPPTNAPPTSPPPSGPPISAVPRSAPPIGPPPGVTPAPSSPAPVAPSLPKPTLPPPTLPAPTVAPVVIRVTPEARSSTIPPASSLQAPTSITPSTPAEPAGVQPTAVRSRVPPTVTAAPPTKELSAGDLVCGQCGEGNEPVRKFCRRCGNSLATAEVAIDMPARGRSRSGPQRCSLPASGRNIARSTSAPWFASAQFVVVAVVLIGGIAYGAVPQVRNDINSTIQSVTGSRDASYARAGGVADGELGDRRAPGSASD